MFKSLHEHDGKRKELRNMVSVVVVSFIVFMLADPIPFTEYVGLLDIILILGLLSYFDKRNKDFIKCITEYSLSNAAAYILERLMAGNIQSYSFCGRNTFFYVCFFVMIGLYSFMGISLCVFDKNNKENIDKEEKQNIDFAKSDNGFSEWFIEERKYDLSRLEDYLTHERIVGIDGEWGTGKTVLKKEFCRRHVGEIYEFTVDVLTCNEGELEMFILSELEKLLADNHIFSSNAVILKGLMSKHSFLNDIRMLLWGTNDTKSNILSNYKKDIHKIGKPVIISVEDLDRLQDINVIKKILDFTERLADEHIKVIYEYDAENLKRLGIDRDYLEKYIPFVVNLTGVTFQKAIEYYGTFGVGDPEAYRFLTNIVYPEKILLDELEFASEVNLDIAKISLRKVKIFLDECEKYLRKKDLNPKMNKNTIITFFFMKHFSNDIYEELDFRFDCLSEMKLESPKTHKRYSIQELINEVRKNKGKKGVHVGDDNTKEDVREFFIYDGTDKNIMEITKKNSFKYFLLNRLGYSFKFMDEDYKQRQSFNNGNIGELEKARYEEIYQKSEISLIQHNKNEKVSRIIRNLHANGLSEYTDEEAVAKKFIETVICSDDIMKAWDKFLGMSWKGDIAKDNSYIFRIMGKRDVDLAKALFIYLQREDQKDKGEDIWGHFLDFRYNDGREYFGKDIDPEYISFCYYIDIDSKDIFLKQVRYFNEMKVVGNLKREKIYREFLKKYFGKGYMLGYFSKPSDFHLDYLVDNTSNVDYVIDFLKSEIDHINKEIESAIFFDNAVEDYNAVAEFLKKNIMILKTDKSSKRRRLQIKTDIRSEQIYVNKEVYNILEEKCKSDIDRDELLKELNNKYEKKQLSVREMKQLCHLYDELHREDGVKSV